MADDLTPEMAAYREAVAAAAFAKGAYFGAWSGPYAKGTYSERSAIGNAYAFADAVLAVPHPEVERLERRWADQNARLLTARNEARAERDALRSGVLSIVESYTENEKGDIAPEDGWRFVRDLRTYLAGDV